MTMAQSKPSDDAIDSLRWYHTLELPGGVVTPGEYDLRKAIERLPMPDSLTGARCLDVGSRDGFYAFEMERRGAIEVVSLDIEDPADINFPGRGRPSTEVIRKELDDGHRAFETASRWLDSNVTRRRQSVYDLDQSVVGTFDFAVIGTLLLHLRDPVRALSAIRGVLAGQLLMNEAVIPGLASFDPRPKAEMLMPDGLPFWWLCNPAGLRRLAEAGGFRIISWGRPYVIPWGASYSPPSVSSIMRESRRGLPRRLLQQRFGSLHAWVLAASDARTTAAD
ncbi:MAG: tRNA (mo5U34)-methyltransferase [Solirubrobacterales bacterium]|jgi:tRNA (mo5U34)-methyltransferase|nr:tRNA (mo5U34)-methyltransferase [Solirubrobacterales bacterium]